MQPDPTTPQPEIEVLLLEQRTFAPDSAFVAAANVRAALYEEADRDPEAFWAAQARERISWVTRFETTLEWDLPFAKWFGGGTLNVAYNCVDRHVERGLGDKVAYHWIGEPGDTRTITFADLQVLVNRAANALKELGVQTGDRVAIYMPMIPELPVAMLACARIGAPFTVVFGGFSSEALADRINDAGAKVLITADGGWRRGRKVGLKHHADEAVAGTPTIQHVLVVNRLRYFTGDGAKRDDDGYLWLLGRVDDVMNVAGHRLSTIEVESALVDHPSVAEAAVVGRTDDISGQAILAFVTLRTGHEPSAALAVQLREHVAYVIGPIARPKYLLFTPDLPKTRSGKIMRRLLRDLAEGRALGDTTTLADASVVDTIRDNTGTAED